MTILAVLFFLFSAGSKPVEIEVDKIEINTCYADFTQEFNRWKVPVIAPSYKQILVYEWNQEYGRYNIRDWLMIESVQAILSADKRNKWHSMVEERIYYVSMVGEYYHVRVNLHGEIYKLKTKVLTYTECLSEDDPERQNQKLFDEKYRNKIFKH